MPQGWSEDRPELVGGHVAVDLVNTVSWRLDDSRTVDRLGTFAVLLRWAERAELLDRSSAAAVAATARAEPDAAESALRAARQLRERVYGTLSATAAAVEPSAEDISAIHKAFVAAMRHAAPSSTLPLRWTIVARTPDDLVRLLALHAGELLRSPDVRRVRQCAGAGCGWLFLDRTRNHSRRWCDTGDCGNRERARRHYLRHRPG